jgi:tRNA(fMet)-specific endonuclease VapC
VLYELEVGVAKSSQIDANRKRLKNLLGSDFVFLPFEREDAKAAAHIRALLKNRKQPIGPYDTLIAGQALARGLTLITSNVREFSRVEGLRWEDWGSQREVD